MEWIKSYLSLMLVFLVMSHLTPKEEYRKYYQFFLGVLLAITIIRPLIGWTSKETWIKAIYEVERLYGKMNEITYEANETDVYSIFLGEEYD